MEALFTTKTIITYDEFKKYSNYMSFSGKNRIKMVALLLFMLAMIGAVYWLTDVKSALIVTIIYVVLFPAVYFVKLKKAYKSNKKISQEREAVFYTDKVISKAGESSGEWAYDDLYAVYETKSNFYIMVSNIQGIIIIKDNCSEELMQFIRNIKKD